VDPRAFLILDDFCFISIWFFVCKLCL
jgi:hypothetical protein